MRVRARARACVRVRACVRACVCSIILLSLFDKYMYDDSDESHRAESSLDFCHTPTLAPFTPAAAAAAAAAGGVGGDVDAGVLAGAGAMATAQLETVDGSVACRELCSSSSEPCLTTTSPPTKHRHRVTTHHNVVSFQHQLLLIVSVPIDSDAFSALTLLVGHREEHLACKIE